MAQSIYDIIKDFGIPITTLVVGFISGVYATIYTDKRKEFNGIVNPLYFRMKAQIEARVVAIDDFNPDVIEPYIRWYRRKSFRQSVERYKNSKCMVGEYDVKTSLVNVDEVEKNEMLKYAADVLMYLKGKGSGSDLFLGSRQTM